MTGKLSLESLKRDISALLSSKKKSAPKKSAPKKSTKKFAPKRKAAAKQRGG